MGFERLSGPADEAGTVWSAGCCCLLSAVCCTGRRRGLSLRAGRMLETPWAARLWLLIRLARPTGEVSDVLVSASHPAQRGPPPPGSSCGHQSHRRSPYRALRAAAHRIAPRRRRRRSDAETLRAVTCWPPLGLEPPPNGRACRLASPRLPGSLYR
ncbi:hypothetical protein BDV95DRAFT_54795 [Massariosphaeria phaeospora]|uniref:Uncharacterized protein n=1 Tax=Massariosphaeria phaeospora TaxID=100035 RepID=A0A7C8I7B1_9PLEO|nr:hypothetical protein BDV95DRAFT_54795 [Massariosphaeria phaeospora]